MFFPGAGQAPGRKLSPDKSGLQRGGPVTVAATSLSTLLDPLEAGVMALDERSLTRAFVSFTEAAAALERAYAQLQAEVGRLLHRASRQKKSRGAFVRHPNCISTTRSRPRKCRSGANSRNQRPQDSPGDLRSATHRASARPDCPTQRIGAGPGAGNLARRRRTAQWAGRPGYQPAGSRLL